MQYVGRLNGTTSISFTNSITTYDSFDGTWKLPVTESVQLMGVVNLLARNK